MITIDELLTQLYEQESDSEMDLQLFSTYFRYAYASGYLRGLEDPAAHFEIGRSIELEGRARLP